MAERLQDRHDEIVVGQICAVFSWLRTCCRQQGCFGVRKKHRGYAEWSNHSGGIPVASIPNAGGCEG